MRPLPYVGYEQLTGRSHVMVDGAAREDSVLTLSHWPQSPTPPELARDVSADIVLAYIAEGTDRAPEALAVTNDHFDEDGVMSVAALVHPDWAIRNAQMVVDAAACGDFGVVASDEAAKVSFAIAPLAEVLAGAGSGTTERYLSVLPAVQPLVADPDRFEPYWRDEMGAFVLGRRAVELGEVVVSEVPEVDLAVVERVGPLEALLDADRLAGASGGLPVHAAAVHSATPATRILAFDGDRCELYLRYEGWVRYVSREVPLRPDLAPLAAALSAEEPAGVTWVSNPVGAIVGRLQPAEGRTDLANEQITAAVVDHLGSAPPAWDPFRPGGSYIPSAERAAYKRPGRPGRRARRPGKPRRPKSS